MKTTIENNKGKVNSSAVNGNTEKDKVNVLPVNTPIKDKAKEQDPASPKEQNPINQNGQAHAEKPTPKEGEQAKAEEKQAEPTKVEIKAKLAEEKPALNLEQTLKKIKDLSRLSNQRDKLIETTNTLDAFEIAQMDQAEETSLNHFQSCTLIIKDDTGKEFTTKNAFIIDKTANQIKTLCYDKLAEVEAQISLTL